jgi:hypothetical protein
MFIFILFSKSIFTSETLARVFDGALKMNQGTEIPAPYDTSGFGNISVNALSPF